ncbi:GIY-YIG nuclease family protein [Halomonas sp. DP8Y7-1]|uniref:GIY-YIG nuclease family protein n=1 Tax=Halomonas sp. DP8Y7-1 TaxID=2859078 RepID=UPI0039656EFD
MSAEADYSGSGWAGSDGADPDGTDPAQLDPTQRDSSGDEAGNQAGLPQTSARWYLYVVETAAGALYTGITTDVPRRLEQHRSGKGAKALRGKGPLTLRHHEVVGSRSEASRLEAAVKRMTVRSKRQWLTARRDSGLPVLPAEQAQQPPP